MKRKLYAVLASLIDARENCRKSGNTEWFDRHEDKANELADNYLPSGSGFDSGTKISWDKSTGSKLVLETSYHHMNENGYYDGWTDHTVTVTGSLTSGFDMKIGGRDRNGFKDYAYDVFSEALNTEVEY